MRAALAPFALALIVAACRTDTTGAPIQASRHEADALDPDVVPGRHSGRGDDAR